ncbi:MAG: hypothetical protein OEZ13_11645 [Spirochaetia bacterium]|nr:hypothetical protein [Spirochaetia bacterium]
MTIEENNSSNNETENQMSQSEEESKIVLKAIKGRFHAPKEQYYGISLFMINNDLKHIDSASTVVSGYSEIYNISLLDGWKALEEKIQKVRYEGQYAKAVTNDLQDNFKYLILDSDFSNEFIENVLKDNKIEILEMLKEKIQKSIHDENLKLEIELENITQKDLNTKPNDDESNESSDDSEGVFLNVNLVLAPVNGKLVNDLKTGETIMVRIVPDNDKANYYIDLLKLRKEKGIMPAPAKILKIESSSKGIRLLLNLTDGVYANVLEEEKVLVRIYDPVKDNPNENQKSKEKETPKEQEKVFKNTKKKEKSVIPFILGSAFILILLILMLTYVLSM